VQQAARRAADLTRQLLAFARKQTIQPQIIDLSSLVLELSNMIRPLIGEQISLIQTVESAGWVRADPNQIEQVVMNLAVNARDAMPDGGTLQITTDTVRVTEWESRLDLPPGAYVRVTVTDTGIGMTEEVQEHLFEPFFTTKPKGSGTGLGLATCYGIITQSGGHIGVESAPGLGTRIEFYLPRADEAVAVVPARSENASPAAGAETVLLVEDEALVRGIAVQALRAQGYRVLEAANGQEALQIAQRHLLEVALLITDVIMPEMGGKELAERLRAAQPALKVLFVSGYTDGAIALTGGAEPEEALLLKPFTPLVLARKVREILDAPEKRER
jgi:CheY-like chemotaxis protein